jgi:hypothetical protein
MAALRKADWISPVDAPWLTPRIWLWFMNHIITKNEKVVAMNQ